LDLLNATLILNIHLEDKGIYIINHNIQDPTLFTHWNLSVNDNLGETQEIANDTTLLDYQENENHCTGQYNSLLIESGRCW